MRAALFVALAACGSSIPQLPSKGGPAWTELESEHFTLWTDASVTRGRELVREMERLHQVVDGVAFPSSPTDGKSLVIALRDREEVNAYISDNFIAFAWIENPLLLPVIVLPADTDESDGHVVAHELTHVISYAPIHKQPVWFAEGLAMFFATTSLDPSRSSVTVGEPLKTDYAETRRLTLVPGEQLFACTAMDCRDRRFYMTSGVLFQFLANVHPNELLKYEEQLAANDPEAWQHALPMVPVANIDRELRTWMMQGQHRVWNFTAKFVEPHIRERALSDAEVLAERALLAYGFHPDPKADIAAALAADPTSVLARLIEYHQTHAVGGDPKALVAAHPDDWRAWLLLAIAQHDKDARKRACALAKANPSNLNPLPCPLDVVPGGGEHGGQPVGPDQVP